MAERDFFAGIRRKPHTLSSGEVDLPILYRDGSHLCVFFRADPERAAALLPGGGDGPFEVHRILGKAMVLFAAFAYRDTTIGPYGEIGLAVMSKLRGTRPSLLGMARDLRQVEESGLYVVNLPVTTEVARAGGREIWGYPKYVAGITCDFREDGATITLEGELRLKIGRGRGFVTDGLPFCTFTLHDGDVLRTVVDVGHRVRWGGAGTVELEVLGDGPTARSVETLGIAGGPASLAYRTDAMLAILPHGKPVADWVPVTATPVGAAWARTEESATTADTSSA